MHVVLDPNSQKEFSQSEYRYSDWFHMSENKMFGPINRVNILIGANNSGKSRLMRGLMKSRPMISFDEKALHTYLNSVARIYHELSSNFNGVELKIIFPDRPFDGNRTGIPSEILKFVFDARNSKAEYRLNSDYWKEKSIDFFGIKDIRDYNQMKIRLEDEIAFIYFLQIFCSKISNYSIALRDRFNLAVYHPPDIFNNTSFLTTVGSTSVKLIKELKNGLNFKVDNLSPAKHIYIPILRSASSIFNGTTFEEPGTKIPNPLLKSAATINFKVPQNTKTFLEVHAGDDLYDRISFLRNDIHEVRKGIEEFELFLSHNFFENKSVDIIAKHKQAERDKNIIVRIGNEEQDIHDLGDGIQATIILMFAVYNAPAGSWIFIEEPELNLHPGFQRVFLETLIQNEYLKSKDLTIFLTTHSNHLVDLSVESDSISVFSFKKNTSEQKPTFEIKSVKRGDLEILSGLGVNNSSVFMSNCSIWVEGVTDRVYIRAFLRAYYEYKKQPELYKEDIHYAFFEYAGSNISHYLFSDINRADSEEVEEFEKIKAQYLSNRIFLVADKDKGKKKKHLTLLKQENSKFTYFVLPVREIENLSTPKQIRSALPNLRSEISIEKAEALKIAVKDYRSTLLGGYIRKIVRAQLKIKLPESFEANSGTMTTLYKRKLAKTISDNITWSDMSKSAKALTKSIAKFISDSNK